MSAGNPSAQVRTDPVTLQVMTNAIYSVADEMVAALIRTSFSTNIKDRRDCSGAVFTRDGQLVAQGEVGTPLHLGVMLPAVQTAIAAVPPETLEPEDDIIVNTPYPEGPGHLNDVTLVSPVFDGPHLVAYVANMSHHVDVGGFAPGSMAFGVWEHYQEGLQIPPLKLVKRGRIDEDLVRLITANLRTPVEFRGDLAAQIAANNVGEERLQGLMRKYGRETVLHYMNEIMDYSERRLSAAIGQLPQGSFSSQDFLEGDGISTEKIAIRVTVNVQGVGADGRLPGERSPGPGSHQLPSALGESLRLLPGQGPAGPGPSPQLWSLSPHPGADQARHADGGSVSRCPLQRQHRDHPENRGRPHGRLSPDRSRTGSGRLLGDHEPAEHRRPRPPQRSPLQLHRDLRRRPGRAGGPRRHLGRADAHDQHPQRPGRSDRIDLPLLHPRLRPGS